MKLAAIALLILMPITSHAETWKKQYTINFALGEADSKTTARELAIEKLRLNAINDAGKYVETTSTLTGDNLRETIKVLSSSIIKLSGIREEYTVQNNRVNLTLTATAEISEDELKRRVDAINQDESKLKAINTLSKNNALLFAQVESLVNMRTAELTSKQLMEAIAKQTRLIDDIRANEIAVTKIVDIGSLVAVVNASKIKLQQAKHDVETNFITKLLALPINTQLIGVTDNTNGTYTAMVNVSWDFTPHLVTTLNPHFETVSNSEHYQIPSFIISQDNLLDYGKGIYNYLSSNQVSIMLNMGKQSYKIPIMWTEASGLNCKYSLNQKSNKSHVCLRLSSPSDVANFYGLSYGNKNTNPIKFTLSQTELESTDKISYTIVRDKIN